MASAPKTPSRQGKSEANGSISVGWQGSLPPPGALQQFNEIIPNGADRIMRMTEQEQKHRHALDKKRFFVDALIELGGRILGAILLVACLVASAWSVYKQAPWQATVAFTSLPILATIGMLFTKQRKN